MFATCVRKVPFLSLTLTHSTALTRFSLFPHFLSSYAISESSSMRYVCLWFLPRSLSNHTLFISNHSFAGLHPGHFGRMSALAPIGRQCCFLFVLFVFFCVDFIHPSSFVPHLISLLCLSFVPHLISLLCLSSYCSMSIYTPLLFLLSAPFSSCVFAFFSLSCLTLSQLFLLVWIHH